MNFTAVALVYHARFPCNDAKDSHFVPFTGELTGPCLESWTLLSALAAQTKQVRVGVLVTGNTYRPPALLAKMAVTVDHVSNGRLILGLGAGWHEQEHRMYGFTFPPTGERARRLREAVTMFKQLFTTDKSTFDGKYYQLKDAPFAPKAVQKPHPSILIGGTGQQVILPLAARHANVWHFYGGSSAESIRQSCTTFAAVCRKVGRNPDEVEKATSLYPSQLTGTSTEVIAQLQALADAGIGHLIIELSQPYDRQFLRRFATDILPKFR
uniref:Putative family F420-dependent LLM class oxidoreductase n=1 Tax=uncultured organism TaxID=155900 RepID=A0A8A1VA09_9ZZZZ|nr:putative family F420-dependent LLM class oxidoreductase [uncultured organism]